VSPSEVPLLGLRDIRGDDLEALLALNRASEPGVGAIDAPRLRALVAVADLARVAVLGETIVGGLVALLPGRAYGSPNYRWFEAAGDRFLYVDRVMVAACHHGRGVGRLLYEDAIATARRLGAVRIVAEVNEVPPNPVSMAFHDHLGFRRLASETDPRNGKRVAMLERPLR
jgi:predicted GNAT superfamily acetyltransferase